MKNIFAVASVLLLVPLFALCGIRAEAQTVPSLESIQSPAELDKAIAARSDTQDSFYRRGLCALKLGDATAAVPDLERVVAKEPDYDFHRAAGLLAHACAKAGQKEKAEALSGDAD